MIAFALMLAALLAQPRAHREPQCREPCAKITGHSFCHTRLLLKQFWSGPACQSLLLWENIFVRQSNAVAYQEAYDSHSELFTPSLVGLARSPMLTAGVRLYLLPGFGLLSSEVPSSPTPIAPSGFNKTSHSFKHPLGSRGASHPLFLLPGLRYHNRGRAERGSSCKLQQLTSG